MTAVTTATSSRRAKVTSCHGAVAVSPLRFIVDPCACGKTAACPVAAPVGLVGDRAPLAVAAVSAAAGREARGGPAPRLPSGSGERARASGAHPVLRRGCALEVRGSGKGRGRPDRSGRSTSRNMKSPPKRGFHVAVPVGFEPIAPCSYLHGRAPDRRTYGEVADGSGQSKPFPARWWCTKLHHGDAWGRPPPRATRRRSARPRMGVRIAPRHRDCLRTTYVRQMGRAACDRDGSYAGGPVIETQRSRAGRPRRQRRKACPGSSSRAAVGRRAACQSQEAGGLVRR